jgi:hypothetical protein
MVSPRERQQLSRPAIAHFARRPKDYVDVTSFLRKDRPSHGKFYSYAVDTFASVSFWTPVAMVQEVFVAGLTVKQSLEVRGISMAINLVAARPYGIFRDKFFKMLKTDDASSQLRRYWTDYIAFSAFWTPLYVGMLACAGSNHEQIAKAVGFGLITNFVTGRPFGAYFDFVRRKAGLKAAWEK